MMSGLKHLWICALLCLSVAGAGAAPCCVLGPGFTDVSGLMCTQRWLHLGGPGAEAAAWQALRQGEFVGYGHAPALPHPAWERDSVFLGLCLYNDTDAALDLLVKFRDIAGAWLWEGDSLLEWPFLTYGANIDPHRLLRMPERQCFTYRLLPGQTARFLYRSYYPYWAAPLYPHIYEIGHYERQKSRRLGYITLLNGAVFGVGLISILSALLLYTQMRDKVFPAYALYVGLFLVYFWRDFEYLNLQFYSTLLHVRWIYTKTFFPVAICLSYVLFVRRLLDTRHHLPRLDRLMTALSWLMPLLVVLDHWLLAHQPSWSYYVSPYGVSWLVWGLMLVMCHFFWATGDPVARYVVLGSLSITLGGVAVSTLPVRIHEWIIRGAFVVELCCFMAALAYRAKVVLQEKEYLRQALWEEGVRHRMEMETKLAIEKAVAEERLRIHIAHDIHDELGGSLTKILLLADIAALLANPEANKLKADMARIAKEARLLADQLRTIVFAINPDFDRFGEIQAHFRWVAGDLWEGIGGPTLHFDFEKSPHNPMVPPDVKRDLMLLFKEAQHNVVKHAQASNVWLTFKLLDAHTYLLEVRDDGRGMDIAHLAGHTHGLGGMRKRAARMGAVLELEGGPGAGLCVRVRGGV